MLSWFSLQPTNRIIRWNLHTLIPKQRSSRKSISYNFLKEESNPEIDTNSPNPNSLGPLGQHRPNHLNGVPSKNLRTTRMLLHSQVVAPISGNWDRKHLVGKLTTKKMSDFWNPLTLIISNDQVANLIILIYFKEHNVYLKASIYQVLVWFLWKRRIYENGRLENWTKLTSLTLLS